MWSQWIILTQLGTALNRYYRGMTSFEDWFFQYLRWIGASISIVEYSDASGYRLNNLSRMQVLKTQLTAKGKGYSDVLYLDAVENKYVEEVSSCNIFMVKVCAIARWWNWFHLHCNYLPSNHEVG